MGIACFSTQGVDLEVVKGVSMLKSFFFLNDKGYLEFNMPYLGLGQGIDPRRFRCC